MILVEDIKIREVPGNRTEIFHYDDASEIAPLIADGQIPKDRQASGHVESVYGQEFVDPHTNRRVMIGLPNKIGEALRLPLGAFSGMSSHICRLMRTESILRGQVSGLQDKLDQGYQEFEAFIGMGFWKRLRFLFTGRGMYRCPEAGDK